MPRNFGVTIDMRKLVHVEMTKKGKDGQPVKGMFIPYERNHMVEGKEYNDWKPMELRTSLHVKDEADDKGRAGFLKQKIQKKWSDQTDEDKEIDDKLPYLGNLFEFGTGGGNGTSGAASEKTFDAEGDSELPF